VVKLDDSNALHLMAQLEGEDWAKAQSNTNAPFTFGHLLAGYEKLKARQADGNPKASWAGLVELGPTIYGRGSMNRYFVDTSGEIFFSRHHGTRQGAEKAAELGFSIR
jgi:hypothetical protein